MKFLQSYISAATTKICAAKMSFEDFCDDVLNKSIGLLSANEIEQAQLAYQNWLKPNKQPTKPDHPDMKKPLSALIERTKRLVQSQKYAIEKFSDDPRYKSAIEAGLKAIEYGEAILANKKSKKSDFIAHAEMNSTASRLFNKVG